MDCGHCYFHVSAPGSPLGTCISGFHGSVHLGCRSARKAGRACPLSFVANSRQVPVYSVHVDMEFAAGPWPVKMGGCTLALINSSSNLIKSPRLNLYPTAFFACARTFAQRFLAALLILALPAADRTRFF